jgi:splicing factor 3B subunit 2
VVLTEETKEALGMTEDGPPPWLINMQRYGKDRRHFSM